MVKELGRGAQGAAFSMQRDDDPDEVAVLKWFMDPKKSKAKVKTEMTLQAAAADEGLAPAVYETVSQAGRIGVFMEMMSTTLSREIKANGFSLDMQRQVVALFNRLGEAGIIHNDPNSNNLMVDPHGRVKFIDFGFSRKVKPKESYGSNPNVYYMASYFVGPMGVFRATGLKGWAEAPVIHAALLQYCEENQLITDTYFRLKSERVPRVSAASLAVPATPDRRRRGATPVSPPRMVTAPKAGTGAGNGWAGWLLGWPGAFALLTAAAAAAVLVIPATLGIKRVTIDF